MRGVDLSHSQLSVPVEKLCKMLGVTTFFFSSSPVIAFGADLSSHLPVCVEGMVSGKVARPRAAARPPPPGSRGGRGVATAACAASARPGYAYNESFAFLRNVLSKHAAVCTLRGGELLTDDVLQPLVVR